MKQIEKSTGIECRQCTPDINNDFLLPCSWYIKEHISKIEFMLNETKILRFRFFGIIQGGRISHHPLMLDVN